MGIPNSSIGPFTNSLLIPKHSEILLDFFKRNLLAYALFLIFHHHFQHVFIDAEKNILQKKKKKQAVKSKGTVLAGCCVVCFKNKYTPTPATNLAKTMGSLWSLEMKTKALTFSVRCRPWWATAAAVLGCTERDLMAGLLTAPKMATGPRQPIFCYLPAYACLRWVVPQCPLGTAWEPLQPAE